MELGLVEIIIIFILLLLLAVIIAVAASAALIVYYRRSTSAESARSTQGRVPCPYCAEMILPQAKVCRYCGRELPADFQKQKIEP